MRCCATPYAGGYGWWVLFAGGVGGASRCWRCLEVMRRVLLCMLEAVEGELCSVEGELCSAERELCSVEG